MSPSCLRLPQLCASFAARSALLHSFAFPPLSVFSISLPVLPPSLLPPPPLLVFAGCKCSGLVYTEGGPDGEPTEIEVIEMNLQ